MFKLMKLTDVDKMDNVNKLLQGRADWWFNGIHHRYGVGVTWDLFVYEFYQECLLDSYRKGKKNVFFKLFQGILKDLYCFVYDILPFKKAKCDRFKQGLHVSIRSSII